MFKYIKKILYQKNIITPKTIYEKIDYLLMFDVSLYTDLYRSKITSFVTDDILKYKNEIAYINNFDMYSKYIDVKQISPNLIKSLTFSKWCSDEGHILEDEILELKYWLIEARKLIENHETASRSVSLNILYSNSLKIRPYSINIKDIVEDIYSVFNNK